MTLKSRIMALGAAAMMTLAAPLAAEGWKPDGALTIQVGFGAGGSTDTMGRVLASVMEKNTGWDIVVENKPGGGGVAMFTGLSQRPPQGKVVGMGVSIPVLVQLVQRGDQLPFDVDSFDYLGTVAKAELALVASADAPFDDLEGLIAYSKEQGQLAVATMAPPQVLMMKATTKTTGADFNLVTADGGAEVMKLILGGQVLAGFGSGEQFPYLESGDMKVIAGANQSRLSYAPEVKTFVESGINAYVDPVFYLATTKGTDPAAVEAIAAAIDEAVASPEMAEIVQNAVKGAPINMGPEGTHKMMTDGLANAAVLFAK
ncbi:tripartite tricarboxylate transporter substrate-binding protein [Phaeobacter gallaeciensis]|uniref:Bug family tripartite tricarboxylate transporter substrate binding protein n=1 Tax=Rhodobacterales TaxID=204455 RepID=UPI00237F0D0C|nr:tripartite tricarboxylate transporter substrate-binding protein [Phaeobacter gallaeciensis]MDE4303049.1 tripartite tricarboxylate transporter substrate-binding protein [Phaeobacter gallaeciensis]MDE4307441.1 tripartite tricarboxylate transporter substrate-binding protein [Phaeobacter gallaeciensis]MDE4311899.1 tripartite tricarboxylate transporter substrate-binding protein [Phaeobacter gallaeciensis]MDE4316596.1 tripartite tricarboxylate transporter substrate-binding protein [Phaeobacter gal